MQDYCAREAVNASVGGAGGAGIPAARLAASAAAPIVTKKDFKTSFSKALLSVGCRRTAGEALAFLSAALEEPAGLPRGLHPLEPLLPMLQSALAAEAAEGRITPAAAGTPSKHAARTPADPDTNGWAHEDGGEAVAPAAPGATGLSPDPESNAPRRLPAVMALFLAEAAAQLAAPEAAMHRRLGKLLSARPNLDLDVSFAFCASAPVFRVEEPRNPCTFCACSLGF